MCWYAKRLRDTLMFPKQAPAEHCTQQARTHTTCPEWHISDLAILLRGWNPATTSVRTARLKPTGLLCMKMDERNGLQHEGWDTGLCIALCSATPHNYKFGLCIVLCSATPHNYKFVNTVTWILKTKDYVEKKHWYKVPRILSRTQNNVTDVNVYTTF